MRLRMLKSKPFKRLLAGQGTCPSNHNHRRPGPHRARGAPAL